VFDSTLPLIVLLAVVRPVAPQDTEGASRVFARYLAGIQQACAWSVESIEIEASLPQLRKEGHLRAIRRVNLAGEADYQVLEISGDQTVRQQVINRYLTGQATAAEMPPDSIAMTPANYEFRYKGAANLAEAVVYVFQIKPRKKRRGLMSGELWLDGETGAAIRQSGYLVKSPSVFVKRVAITRETVLDRGVVRMRLTHLSVDTRLVGLADLTVTERPL
jgi:hypothetical protein